MQERTCGDQVLESVYNGKPWVLLPELSCNLFYEGESNEYLKSGRKEN
jgi:hypothetical protein